MCQTAILGILEVMLDLHQQQCNLCIFRVRQGRVRGKASCSSCYYIAFIGKGSGGICRESGKGMVLITTIKALLGPERHFKSTDHHDQTEISWHELSFIKIHDGRNCFQFYREALGVLSVSQALSNTLHEQLSPSILFYYLFYFFRLILDSA